MKSISLLTCEKLFFVLFSVGEVLIDRFAPRAGVEQSFHLECGCVGETASQIADSSEDLRGALSVGMVVDCASGVNADVSGNLNGVNVCAEE